MKPHIEIAAEKIFFFFGFPVTNTLLMSWLVFFLGCAAVWKLRHTITLVPSFLQNVLELVAERFLGVMESMFGSRENAERYFPLIATIFLFILISNWLGIFPGVGSIGFFEEVNHDITFLPLFRSAASDLNFTLALGIVTIFLVNTFGAKSLGLRVHLAKFFSLKSPLDFFVGILEFISEIAKIISFSFRLFGNIFAGEVLLIIVAFLAPFIIPVPFLAMELFVGFIQALVFSMLTMVFISIAVSHH